MSLYNSEPKYIAPHMPWPPPFCWKTDAQRSSSDPSSLSTSLSAWKTPPPGLGPLVVDLIICGVNGDAAPQGVPLQGVSHHLPKHDEARHGSRRIKAGWVGWVGWSPVGHAVATCWSSALGNVAAGLETNRCVERQPVLDGPVPPQGFFQGLAAEVTQAAFVTLQKVELKKNLTVRICEDLLRETQ